jgi:hypothetical protein
VYYNSISKLSERPVNKGELVERIAEKADGTKREVEAVLNTNPYHA